MRLPSVALVSMLLACLLPAQAEESRSHALASDIAALVGKARILVPATGPVHMPAEGRAYAPEATDEIDRIAPAPNARDIATPRDLLPVGNGFFLGGGAYYGDKDVGFSAPPQRTVEVGGMAFTPEEYGRPESQLQYKDVVPFVGGGFNTRFSANGQWDVKVLAGAAFFGPVDPGARPVAGLPLSADPQADRDFRKREVSPMVQVGLSYRF